MKNMVKLGEEDSMLQYDEDDCGEVMASTPVEYSSVAYGCS